MNVAALRREDLENLPLSDLVYLRMRAKWLSTARPEQLAPDGDWSVWLILSGRGWGKTQTGAEWIVDEAIKDPGSISFIVAPTHSDVQHVCIEGPSGIKSFLPEELVEGGWDKGYNKSDHIIRLTNGSLIRGFSATEPNRLRGPQCHRVWCDELAAWVYLQATWDNIVFGCRLGNDTRKVVTTTPRPLAFLRDLVKEPSTYTTTGSTYENQENLADDFLKKVLKYEGTELGKQEIYGEILDFSETGIIKKSWLKMWPREKALPRFYFILQSYDTALKGKPSKLDVNKTNREPDDSACSTWGVFRPTERSPFCVMLLDAWNEKLNYPELRERLKEDRDCVYGKDDTPVNVTLVEDTAAGPSLIADLADIGVHLEAYNPGRDDKLMRLHLVSHLPKQGLVYVPESLEVAGEFRPWAMTLVDQLCTLSLKTINTQPDDLADTVSQALDYLEDAGWIQAKDRLPPPPPSELKRQENPYG
jgi:phage terminase large subunit-like protein